MHISTSTVNDINKGFSESVEILVHKGHSSVADITTGARDYFGNPLSTTTIWSHLKFYCAKKKPGASQVYHLTSVYLFSG